MKVTTTLHHFCCEACDNWWCLEDPPDPGRSNWWCPFCGESSVYNLESEVSTVPYADVAEDPWDKWIPWYGGDCPLIEDTMVFVQTRDGSRTTVPLRAGSFGQWFHGTLGWAPEKDIVAFKFLRPCEK